VNDAAVASASYPTNGSPATTSASLSNATLQYDLATRSYTITVGSRSMTFLPSDLDAAQSTAQASVYLKTNGSTSDSLTLTKAGTSGRFTYQYVGGGYWQNTVNGTAAISGSFDAFAYGFATPNTVMPRTGRAEYAVDLLGIESVSKNVFAITGQGVTQVDFASGAIVTHGTAVGAISGAQSRFFSEAILSSSSNSFSGAFRFDDIVVFNGQISGRFYGPSSQEIGAVFAASALGGSVITGTIIGRGSAVTAKNASLINLTANEFFSNDAAVVTTVLAGSSGLNNNGQQFSATSGAISPLLVNYDASLNAYTLIAPDYSEYLGAPFGFPHGSLIPTTPVNDLYGYPYTTFENLKYTGSKQWLRAISNALNTSYRIEHFVFGIQTLYAQLPRTGTAGYAIGLSGTAANAGMPNLTNITGFGFLTANFASGSLATNGQIDFKEDYIISGRAPQKLTGTFSGNATISSTGNAFSGPIEFSNVGNYTGTMNGKFYGPAAEEVGASFSLTNGLGASAVGTFVGGRDPAATIATPSLLELTAPTTFAHFDAVNDVSNSGRPVGDVTSVSYNPTTGTYSVVLNDTGLQGSPFYTIAFAEQNKVAASSTASFNRYAGSAGGLDYRAILLNPGPSNPKLDLRYTSLIELMILPNSTHLGGNRQFIAFGLPTSPYQMPRNGTANYSGIARGAGTVKTNAFSGSLPSNTTAYDLSGTTSLLADFGNGSFTSTLSLVGADQASSATKDFGTMQVSGEISRNQFTSTHGGTFGYGGTFTGPHAEEFSGTFSHFYTDANGTLFDWQGVVVGKR
jgi:hypothetical protein